MDELSASVKLVTEFAPAKLTLSLGVGAARGDGLHPIEAEMISISLVDTLRVTRPGREHLQVSSDLSVLSAIRGDCFAISEGSDNLVARAAHFAERSVSVELVKRIPIGAGLGGGSSDAAALLRALGWTGDRAQAAVLGADVPYCVQGGAARVSGIGEIVEPIEWTPSNWVLFLLPFGINTASVYRAFDDVGPGRGPNHLVRAARTVEPRLAALEGQLAERTGMTPILAGSGSTLFIPGRFQDYGIEASEQISAGSTTIRASALVLSSDMVVAVEVWSIETLKRPAGEP
ncbi:MAG: 4-(cytidine 5'-diphospho)-2-C-methyl-D-erythritol kinase [Ferrimicrobium sp.]